MRNSGKTLALVLALIFLILTPLVILQPVTVKAQSKTIVVPDNYPTIQAAIDNAISGDTIYVKQGTYQLPPGLSIDKPLSLIGEKPQTTIIDGNGHNYQASAGNLVTLQVGAPDVTISGFTITDCNTAILVQNWGYQSNPSRCKIIGNTFIDNYYAIHVVETDDFEITHNHLINSGGMGVNSNGFHSTGVISENTIEQCGAAISLYASQITVNKNNIFNNEIGIMLDWTGPYFIYSNTIKNSTQAGIVFGRGVSRTLVHDNDITKNALGIKLENFGVSGDAYIGSGNSVYSNNLIDNSQNAFAENSYAYWNHQEINGTDIVSWDNSKVGNYWSDYNGQGSYVINENNVDHYPLTQQINVFISSESDILLPIVIATVIIAIILAIVFLLLYRRHRKNNNK
jgi:nitrous oxidase accessory protein NosD